MSHLSTRLTQAIVAVRKEINLGSITELVLASGQCFKQGIGLGGAGIDQAIREGINTDLTILSDPPGPKLEREFPYMKPRRWQNKKSKKYFKVVPWFQPIDNESRLDFKALFKDLVPEFGDDVLAEMEIYSGLVMHCGYQLYNDGGMWFCVQHSGKDFFKDCGPWIEEKHGQAVPTFPISKKGDALVKEAKAKARKKK